MEQEQRSEDTADNNKRENQQPEITLIWSVSSTATAIWLFLIGAFLLWIFLPDYIPDRAGRAKIFIESIFSLAIVVVIVVHAVMYYKQARTMHAALLQSEKALKITERAYVGVGSIVLTATHSRDIAKRQMQDITLTIENIGRLPADEMRVRVIAIMLVPETIQAKYPNSLSRYYYCDWSWDFKSTKLFRGNFNFEIPVPLADKIDPILWSQVSSGNARIIAQIRIDYKDGFKSQRADYAFRLEGKWIPWWAWTSDEEEARIAEEIDRYSQYTT